MGAVKIVVTAERLKEIRELCLRGHSDPQISNITGLNKSTVRSARLRHGIPAARPCRRHTPERIHKLKYLHGLGFNDAKISEIIQMHRSEVWRRRTLLGLKANSPMSKITPEVEEQIKTLNSQGYNDARIAKHLGLCKRTVYVHRTRLGLKPNKRTKEEYAEIGKKAKETTLRVHELTQGEILSTSYRIKAARLGWVGEDFKFAIILHVLEEGPSSIRDICTRVSEIRASFGLKSKVAYGTTRLNIGKLKTLGLVERSPSKGKAASEPFLYWLSDKAWKKVRARGSGAG